MKKKLLAALLAATMVAGMTACGGSEASGTSTENQSTENKSDNSADSTAIDTSEHVKITYMTTGGKPTNGATEEMLEQLNAILTEKVNAELEISSIDWTDYLSVYNLTLAQMDGTVDLVGTASDWLDAWPNAKNGAFLELSEYMLKTYAPKTWESVSPEHWELCT